MSELCLGTQWTIFSLLPEGIFSVDADTPFNYVISCSSPMSAELIPSRQRGVLRAPTPTESCRLEFISRALTIRKRNAPRGSQCVSGGVRNLIKAANRIRDIIKTTLACSGTWCEEFSDVKSRLSLIKFQNKWLHRAVTEY
jgi:hypothetical protein